MKKLKFIGLIFLLTLSTTVFGQEESEQEESVIVMTEAELESFLKTIADERRSQMESRNKKRTKNELAELRYKYGNQINSGGVGNRDISNYEILRELDRLNARFDYMNSRFSGNLPAGQGSSSTVVVPGSSNSPGYIPYLQGQQPSASESNQESAMMETILNMEKRLDSLTSLQANSQAAKQDNTQSKEITDLKNQFQSLEEKLANAESPTERRSLLEELLEKFKNFKKQVFFTNNSDQLGPNDFAYIQDVAEVLIQYPELSIVLEGWASTRGNANYNKQLSMRRSESVEQALLGSGISPNRIVSSFKGEDTSSSEAMARRVDMSIILK